MCKAQLFRFATAIAALAIVSLAASPAAAATYTWNGPGSSWDISSTNWSSGGPANYWDASDGSLNIADFNTLNVAPVVSGGVYVNGIQFDNTANITGGTINLVTGTLATPTITVNATGGTIGSILTGTSGLAVAGAGTLTLYGANSYSGTTSVNAGTLLLSFASSGAPSTNIVSSSSPLALGGGALSVAGNGGSGTIQTFNGTAINSGASSVTFTNAGGSPVLALGAITRSAAGATVNFTLPASGSISGSSTLVDNIIGPWATTGSGMSLAYATISSGNIAAYTTYGGTGDSSITTPASITAANGTTNYTLNGVTSGTAARTPRSTPCGIQAGASR